MIPALYLHPDDLAREATIARWQQAGLRELALATAYHAGRWLVPAADGPRVRYLQDGVVHFAPQGHYGALLPAAQSHAEPPLPKLLALAERHSLRTRAWTVLFHNSRLGRLHNEFCVHNAMGDRFTYALCPAQPEVQRYGGELVAELGAAGFQTVELEACGWLGHKHGSHHDKNSFAGDATSDFLLSYCFCQACERGLAAAGAQPAALRARVRVLLHEIFARDAMAPQPVDKTQARGWLTGALGEGPFTAMLRHRAAVQRTVLEGIRRRLPSSVRLAVQVQPDVLFTGSQLGAEPAALRGLCDELVLTSYGEGPDAAERLLAATADAGTPRRLAVWPKAPQYRSDADLRRLVALGVELSIYHASLLPEATVTRVLTAMQS